MRNLKKVLALVLALVMAMSLMVTAGATSLGDYKDSESVTPAYATAVDVATQLGILEGVGGDRYAPQGTLTRAQLATMTYRIATGDVTDVYTANFAGGAAESFTDTPADSWYAGYVGYAADAGYLKGVGDGQYKPNSYMTGYQALAAFLRVIGYNQPGQFTGPDWTVQVAQIANQIGALEGITKVDLNKPITREVAAQIIYNILFADNVEYTPAFGYQPNYDTLAENEFAIDLVKSTGKDGKQVMTQPWGRVATEWYNSANEVLVSIAAEPVAVYTTATSECQIAKDLGLKKDANVVAEFLNGDESNCFGGNIERLKTANTVGDQGRLLEVYEFGNDYVVVMIDQFLAQVTKVTEVKYDVNGHVSTPATLTLAIYDEFNGYTDTVVLSSDENYTYAKGDMLLVYYDDADLNIERSRGEDPVVEFVDYADSIVGKQTTLTSKASHIVNGTEYMDAVQLNIDEAGNETAANHTWYFDTYGNLIGIFDIAVVYDYGVISSIYWVDSHDGTDGYAKATITYMNGSSATANVNSIVLGNGVEKVLKGVEGDTASLANGLVSSTIQYNTTEFTNRALYRISENEDGSLVLNSDWQTAAAVVGYIADANVVTGNTNLGGTYNADQNTMYLIWNGESYETYTGVRNVPTYNGVAKYSAWVAETDNDNGVEYVFVIEPSVKSTEETFLYFFNDSEIEVQTSLAGDKHDYYTVKNGYVDGEKGDIKVDAAGTEAYYWNNAKLIELSAFDGKLCMITTVDGYVETITAIPAAGIKVDDDLMAMDIGVLTEDALNDGPTLLTANGFDFDVETVKFVDVADWEEAIGQHIWIVYTATDYDVVSVYG